MPEQPLLLDSLLHPGTEIQVQLANSPLPSLATIHKLTADALVVELALPLDANEPPVAGQKVYCKISNHGNLYQFETALQASPHETSLCWRLYRPKSMTKVQLRRFVRIPYTSHVSWQTFTSATSKKQVPYTGTLIDISGGGLCFRTSRSLPEGELIQVAIPNMPLIGTFKAYASVERCTSDEKKPAHKYALKTAGELFHEDGTPNLEEIFAQIEALLFIQKDPKEEEPSLYTPPKYRIACNFTLMSPPERQQLVASIFELQRNYIRGDIRPSGK